MKVLKLLNNRILNYFYIFTVFICVLVFVFAFFFLYRNFYRVIISAGEVVMPVEEISAENVETDKFDRVFEELQKKIKPRQTNINIKF